ncbi:MAG: hypothetical protein LHV69_01710 [Elusimicrobia bacterium]|nr:hypothetical protein [Candidatus Obscuribacterium magneticum]
MINPNRIERLKKLAENHWFYFFVFLHSVHWIWRFHKINFSSGYPILNTDFVLYYTRAIRTHEFFIRSGRFWGYDPFEMAGYISGPIHEVGNIFTSLLAHLLSSILTIDKTLLMAVFIGFFLCPFLMISFVRNFGGTRDQGRLAFAICILMFGGLDFSTAWWIPGCLFTFFISSFLGLWIVSVFWKWMVKKGFISWLLLTAGISVIFQLHPSSLFIVIIPFLSIYLYFARTLKFKHHIFLSISVLIFFISNWYWIKPLIAFYDWILPSPYLPSFNLRDLITHYSPIQTRWEDSLRSVANIITVVMPCFFLVKLSKHSASKSVLLAIWLMGLAVFPFLGSHIPKIAGLQPLRYLLPFWLLGAGVVSLSLDTSTIRKSLVFLIPLALPVCLLWFNPVCYFSEFPKDLQTVINYIKVEKPLPGRLLLECGDRPNCYPHFSEIIPILTGQPLLGGDLPSNYLITRFTKFMNNCIEDNGSFTDKPVAFGKHLSDIDEKKFAAYLRLYNVSNIAAWSKQSIRILNRHSGILFSPVKIGDHNFYQVKGNFNWFIQGNGNLAMDYDKLTIRGASKGILVIKSHWIKTFKTRPSVPIRPRWLMDDPVPFIEVDNSVGAKDIVIYNAGL